jgi:hypothetical protein
VLELALGLAPDVFDPEALLAVASVLISEKKYRETGYVMSPLITTCIKEGRR